MGIQYKIDALEGEGGRLHVAGWALSEEKRPITWTLSTRRGGPVQSAKYYAVSRPDIGRKFFQTADYADCGFEIEANLEGEHVLLLKLSDGKQTISVRLAPGGVKNRAKKLWRRRKYYQANRPYQDWLRAYRPDKAELAEQKNFSGPLISVVVPVYRTPLPFLKEMIKSIRRQSYPNWQLCLSNSGARDGAVEGYLRRLAAQDERIVMTEETGQLGISENTNRALALAKGEYVGFMDHDDLLEPDALYEIARAAMLHPQAECFYTDEDKVTVDGKIYYEPHFKPGFDRHLLLTNNYISHFFVVRRAFAQKEKLTLRDRMDGSQDYDFILRVTRDLRPGQIIHIAKVLYHWRSHPGSTAAAREAKSYTAEAGLLALRDYCKDSPDICPEAAEENGYYRLRMLPPENVPDVSIIFRNVTFLQQIPQLEELTAAWANGRTEIILETSVGLNRRPRGDWLFFADAAWAEELGDTYRKLASLMESAEVGAVTGKCLDSNKLIRSAGVHLEERDGSVYAVSSFDGFFDERISYGNRTRLRQQVYGAMPVLLMIERTLYEAAGAPVISRMKPEQMLAAAARIGAAARAAGKTIVYEPEAAVTAECWPYPSAAALDQAADWEDPYFPKSIRQQENGDWAVDLQKL